MATTTRKAVRRRCRARIPAVPTTASTDAGAESRDRGTITGKAGRGPDDRDQRTHAYESLRRALILRRIGEGQRLREVEWSRRLGVNRTALREALARLHSEGLVVEGEKTGYFVPKLDKDDLREVLEVRIMAEGLAIERIVRLGLNRRRCLAPLHESCDDLEWILKKGYILEIAEADRLFHEKLVALSGNRRLITLHRCLPLGELTVAGFDLQRCASAGRDVLRYHRRLLDAIESKSPSLAKQILREHLIGHLSGTEGPHSPNASPRRH